MCFLAYRKGDHHGAQAHEDAGNIARHKQRGDGHAAGYRGVHDEGAGGRDQKSCGGGGDVCRGREGRVIALLLLDGIDAAAHSGCRGHGGAGQGAEEHVAHDVGLG